MCIPSYTHAHTHALRKRQLSLAKLRFPPLFIVHLCITLSLFIYSRVLVLDILKTVILDFGSQVVMPWESEHILRKTWSS